MNRFQPILFQDALNIAREVTEAHGMGLGRSVTLVRDLRGKIRALLDGMPASYSADALTVYRCALSERLGAYGFSPSQSILFVDELQIDFESLQKDRSLIESASGLEIFLLDRQVTGHDWMRGVLPRQTSNPRFTFFGIKGGVGRSTALVHWAWHLAKQGKKVLVFDLDLESPGVSEALLSMEALPDYGIVDWFVEEGVGQEGTVEPEMVGLSQLAREEAGEIRVVPAHGKKSGAYLPKLSRCYAEFSGSGRLPWAERLQKMVESLERTWKPDVVLLDSRAGLHDIAAVLVTRMDADTLLLAVDSPQTWSAYGLLFRHWQTHPQVREFRDRLQIVASMVPETGRANYLKSFTENAYNLFANNLYDEAGADLEGFSFDLNDEDAPHYPLPIFWHRALQEFDPAREGMHDTTAREAMGLFLEQVDRLLVSEQARDLP
ncbi:MAG: AAA family ATPase [Magnetococcales bacterium]|nr:AAA family ATPase [Magnetococcales bacterium]